MPLVETSVPFCVVHVLYILCLASSGLLCLGCKMVCWISCILVQILAVDCSDNFSNVKHVDVFVAFHVAFLFMFSCMFLPSFKCSMLIGFGVVSILVSSLMSVLHLMKLRAHLCRII